MSFFVYDLGFLVVFCLAIALFLYIKRKKVVREGLLYLYKTSVGLELIDKLGSKYPKTMKVLSYCSIIIGYILMVLSIYFLVQIIYVFMQPALVKAVKIPPIMPLIPYLDKIFAVTWMPPFYFTYWIIAIALVAIFHEGFHGIFAKFGKVRIKSTGFGFLGPFLAFFVEQDEKQMKKAKIFSQLSVLSAGVFANVLLSIIFFILMISFFNVAYAPAGIVFNDYSYSVASASTLIALANSGNMTIENETLQVDGLNLTRVVINNQSYLIPDSFFSKKIIGNSSELIVKVYHDAPAINAELKGAIIEVNGQSIETNEDISLALAGKKPGEQIKVITEYSGENGLENIEYNFKLGSDYDNSSRPIMGIATIQTTAQTSNTLKGSLYKLFNSFKYPNIYYKAKVNPELMLFLYNLLWWVFMINVSVAIANMIPLGIFDGGRFFYLTVLGITKKEKIAAWSFKIMTWLLLAIVTLMMVLYFIGIF